ncbi:MAG TPA: hypothetical protein PKV71_13075 [Calditrichia bacterium]|nr:hypothetical protein [Calditrichota bacterium]HQU74369.1 hypothetical protein [Calditrichia bacterium]HQV32810.1 hypothetical protein [Calditrichia bacterium]
MSAYFMLDTAAIARRFLADLHSQDQEVKTGLAATLCLDGRGYLMRKGRFSMGVNFPMPQTEEVRYLQFNRGGKSHERAE